MDARTKLQRLAKMFEGRSADLLVIPITVSGERGYVIGQDCREVTKPGQGAVYPLAFILPDEVGTMFMDSAVFTGAEASDALPEPELGNQGPNQADGEPSVEVFKVGPDGPERVTGATIPPRLRQILGEVAGLVEGLEELDRLKKRVDAVKPKADKADDRTIKPFPQKIDSGGEGVN